LPYVGPHAARRSNAARSRPCMKAKALLLFCVAGFCILAASAFAHDPVVRDPHSPSVVADDALPFNYVITFTLLSDDKKQEAELVTARKTVSFDLVDDPDHSLRFQGELKRANNGQMTLSFTATLITMVTAPSKAKQAATTSGGGAILLEFNKPMTILKSPRQQLAVAIRPFLPTQPAGNSSTPAGH
jgi:hypothetical protein